MTSESLESIRPRVLDTPAPAIDARTHQGSLRSKLVLSLGAVFFLFLTIDELVRSRVIQPEFDSLEESGAIRDANRVLAAFNSEVDHLSVLARHWSAQIRESENRGDDDSLAALGRSRDHLDWAATIAEDGTWHWIIHPQRDSRSDSAPLVAHSPNVDPPVDGGFLSLLELCRTSGRDVSSGLTRIDSLSLVLFSLSKLNGESTEDPDHSQFLLVAREVDQAMVESLRRQTQVEFTLQSPGVGDRDQKLVVWEASESTLVVEVQLVGLDDRMLANVYIEVPRDITARSQHTTRLARNSFIFGSVAALLLLLFLLQKIVISPLSAIRKHSDRVAEEGLSTKPLVLNGNDEIGELAAAFDKMVRRLGDAQTQLTETSQAAGRSQVASTVIHNVGNVLTNVNSLIDAACDRTHRLRISPLTKLAERLRSNDETDAMLAATPDYLEGLAGSLQSDQQSLQELLSTLNDNVRHIHDVIRAQRQHTEQAPELKMVPLQDLVDEAITCCQARLEEDSVTVEVSIPDDVLIRCDRSLMLQTMINLIGNARHAMRSVGASDRRLGIRAHTRSDRVCIEFRDNGCGMPPETIQRAFEAHFTTRESGTGLGLHFCAITLQRLGGSIHAASEGPGKGSVFTIEVPQLSTAFDHTHHIVASGNAS